MSAFFFFSYLGFIYIYNLRENQKKLFFSTLLEASSQIVYFFDTKQKNFHLLGVGNQLPSIFSQSVLSDEHRNNPYYEIKLNEETFTSFLHEEDKANYNLFIQNCINQPHEKNLSQNLRFLSDSDKKWRYLKFENHPRTVSNKKTLIKRTGPQTSMIIGIISDETSQIESIDTIQNSQLETSQNNKMIAIEDLAGGLAHEINNPLAIILSKTQTLKLQLSKQGSLSEEALTTALNKIEKATKRASRVVNSLKMLTRDSTSDHPEITSVEFLVNDMSNFLSERLTNHQIEFSITFEKEDLSVRCKPMQVVLVLLNLMTNSFQAIRKNLDAEKWIRIHVSEKNSQVEIRVIDGGQGIPEDIKTKIFNPFFTSHEVGEALGIGLSVAKSIAMAHKGNLILDENSPNTCFLLTLPKYINETSVKISA